MVVWMGGCVGGWVDAWILIDGCILVGEWLPFGHYCVLSRDSVLTSFCKVRFPTGYHSEDHVPHSEMLCGWGNEALLQHLSLLDDKLLLTCPFL